MKSKRAINGLNFNILKGHNELLSVMPELENALSANKQLEELFLIVNKTFPSRVLS